MTARKKLLISGCSFTHGCETHNAFMHVKNVEQSYSSHLAKLLNVDLDNRALSGASNDYIFFSLVKEIRNTNSSTIHSVIAAWTNVNRLTWRCNDRYWMFNVPWSASVKQLSQDGLTFEPWAENIQIKDVSFNVDDVDYLGSLVNAHEFLSRNYLTDTYELATKSLIYSEALRAICQTKNIKLFELQVYPTAPHFPGYRLKTKHQGHPTAQEHQKIAQELYQEFYLQ